MQAGGGCIVACEKDAESRFISFMDPGLTQSCYVMHEIAGAPLTRGDLGARFLQPTARSKGLTKRGRTKRAQRGQRGREQRQVWAAAQRGEAVARVTVHLK